MVMDINDTARRIRYTATDGQTVFAIPFEFFSNGEITVYRNQVQITYTASPATASQFSVTGAGVEGGGSITLGSGATAGDDILILSGLAIERQGDFSASGPFDVAGLNTQLDKLTAMVRDLETRLERRVVRLATADLPETFSDLPVKATRATKVLGFDGDGQLTVYNYTSSFSTDATYMADSYAGLQGISAAVSGTVVMVKSFHASGTWGGGLFRYDASDVASPDNGWSIAVDTAGRRWKRIYPGGRTDIAMFGVRGDGVNDDSTAWNAMIAALNAGTVKSVYIPPGFNILLKTPNHIITEDNLTIFGDGMDVCRITIASDAGTAGNVFTLGEAVESTVTISNGGGVSAGVVTMTAHGAANGWSVRFEVTEGGSLPTGITAATDYFVVNKTTDTFQISATRGGAGIVTSSAGSGTFKCTVNSGIEHWTIQGLGIYCLNSSTLDGTKPAICIHSSARGTLRDIYAEGMPAFLRVGLGGSNTNQTHVQNVRVVGEKTMACGLFEVRHASGLTMIDVRMGVANGTANSSFRAFKIAPAYYGNIDSLTMIRCLGNVAAGNDVETVFEIDASHTPDLGNMEFINCYAELAKVSAFLIHSDNGTRGSLRAVRFLDCRTTPIKNQNSVGLRIRNTNNIEMKNISWFGGMLSAGTDAAAEITAGNPAITIMSVKIINADINDRAESAGSYKSAIKVGVGGVTVRGCAFDKKEESFTMYFDTGVEYTSASVASGIVEGNDFSKLASPKMGIDTTLLTNINPLNFRFGPNLEAIPRPPIRLTTAASGTFTLATISLDDETLYTIEADVMIKQNNTSNRAGYKVIGTFYRDGGGGATLQGALAVLHSQETVAGMDATLTASGNNVLLTATTTTALTTQIQADVKVAAAVA